MRIGCGTAPASKSGTLPKRCRSAEHERDTALDQVFLQIPYAEMIANLEAHSRPLREPAVHAAAEIHGI